MNPLHCNETNSDLFSEFSDLYKEVYGSRPRHFITEKEVVESMRYLSEEATVQWQEAQAERAFEESIAKGTHPAFAAPDAVLTYSPFTKL